jgi:Cu(I)/Ag(I) efflux system membrane fusion protein
MTRRPQYARLLLFAAAAMAITACARKGTENEVRNDEPADSLVHISAATLRSGQLRVEVVRSQALADTVVLTGQIQADPLRIAHVAPRIAGTVQSIRVVIGDHVAKGRILATLYSPEFSAAQGDYLLAHERLEKARAATGQDLSSLESIAESARRRLETLGAGAEDIALLHRTHQPITYLPLRSPLAGVVTEVETGIGKQVVAGTDLFGISNLDVVWGVLDAYERDYGHLRVGQSSLVRAGAYSGREFEGRVASLEGSVREDTRTLSVRLQIHNQGLSLKPGMFITARIAGDTRPAIVLSEAALQDHGGRTVVFIATSDTTFVPRPVEARTIGSNLAEVTRGLAPGERVAAEGAFLLRSQASRSELGEE